MSNDPFAFIIEEKKVEIKEENIEVKQKKSTNRKTKNDSNKNNTNIKIKTDKPIESVKEKYEKMPIEKLMSIYFMIYGSTIREKKSIIVEKIIQGLNQVE